MADDRVVAEIVSDFFLNTCQLCRRLNKDVFAVLIYSSFIVSRVAATDRPNKLNVIPLTTGSVAE